MFPFFMDIATALCPESSQSNPHRHNVLCKELLLFTSHVRLRLPSGSLFFIFQTNISKGSWSQWPRGLRRRSAAARLLRSWVRIPPGAWIFVCCDCCVLSGRGLCDELITRPEEYYRLWCVVVCDLENLKNEEAMTRVGSQRHRKRKI